MNSVAHRYKDDVDFLLVYISEVHPSDGWYIENNYNIKSHSSTEDRVQAANELVQHGIPYPVVLDDMGNTVAVAYGAFPERVYVVLDGIIVYQSGVGFESYKPADLDTFLKQLISKTL